MAESYEKEQVEIKEKLAEYQEKIDKHNDSKKGVDYFLKLVGKYSEITELTPQILIEFIDKVIIHQTEKSENGTFQTVEIHYKGVGVLNLKDCFPKIHHHLTIFRTNIFKPLLILLITVQESV